VILGTAAYMSPEQAKGKRVDKRADVWAFGVVLYEMLTGKRAFAGEDVSDTLAYVLTKEPEWDALPADLSPTLRTFLSRCLEKDPKRRVRDIGDVRLAMTGAFDTAAPPSSDVSAVPPVRRTGWATIGAALLLGALIGIAVWSSRPEAPRLPARFVVDAPSQAPNRERPYQDVAITPDGTRIVYFASADLRKLLVRDLEELEAMLLGLGDDSGGVFVSPDGNWVGTSCMAWAERFAR